MTNKYKSIPVTNMTIWQLGQAVSDGSEFYDAVGNLIFTSDKHGTLYSHQTAQVDLNDQLMSGQITTREPIMWWDELPKLVMFGAIVGIAFDNPNYRCVSFNGYPVPYDDCTPLTREEAAEYGVEL